MDQTRRFPLSDLEDFTAQTCPPHLSEWGRYGKYGIIDPVQSHKSVMECMCPLVL